MPIETKSLDDINGVDASPTPPVKASIPNVKVTVERRPFLQPDDHQRLPHTGTSRVNVAATYEKPYGTTEDEWAKRHQDKTVLQQHCEFFDFDHDGVIWPQDTFWGFHSVGFGIILSLVAVFIIHANFSYPTLSGWLPDPFFRGRFSPQHFEDMFAKYGEGRDYLTIWDVFDLLKGQRVIADPIGWFGAFFEWLATYLMLWPADGKMTKEDIRGIYDGSIFYKIANRRAAKK
ncbi:Caleosin-domain-containing protein [Hypoxylon trugodes]|uniref:Caleosin-domain-containing protein n=1 Tax=Hypoxylon trugodes TaxID=326681 RepID=UPI0021972D14|nr:Caleosin-domain-containing protein [Hypoxylon trugodes]KAI1392499.1 Caleosin-domain-containing protein [Hypoxylon trugodes]